MIKLSMTGRLAALGMVVTLAACGGEKKDEGAAAAGDTAAAAPAAAPATSEAPATGNVIEVKAMTDEQGNNKFEPANITAKKGDVIRLTLVSGVHNFHITEGVAGATLPAPTQLLQAPGQTEDVKVDLPAGDYKFQCDPHAALGMVGTLKVTE